MLRFPDRPVASVAELQQHMSELIPQLERVVINDVTIGTAETPVAHGGRSTPRTVHVTPKSDARVWMATPADGRLVYLTASASVVVDITVEF